MKDPWKYYADMGGFYAHIDGWLLYQPAMADGSKSGDIAAVDFSHLDRATRERCLQIACEIGVVREGECRG